MNLNPWENAKEIFDYPGYWITDYGRVWSDKSKKWLKTPSSQGYPYCNLCHEGKPKPHQIHRLVAVHFLPNWNNLTDVDHIDRNPMNNKIYNLRWLSHADNIANNSGKGYYYNKSHKGKKWHVRILKNRKIVYQCYCETEQDAQEAVAEARRKYRPNLFK